jgi:hypothetical protein
LSFQWSIYPPEPEIEKLVKILGGETATPRIEIGAVPFGKTIPILLTVKDHGTPRLTRNARVSIRVGASE